MLTSRNPDAHWKRLGEIDPYFAVLTENQYKSGNLDKDAKQRFFASGEDYVKHVMEVIEQHVAADFSPGTALDFGCGVGRLLIPLSSVAERVIGVDVSSAMIAEAQRNCDGEGVTNVHFVKNITDLEPKVTFDLIHSFIVLQHIPTRRGERIVEDLISRLAPGGVGTLHFTYHAARYARLVHSVMRNIPFAANAYNVLIGRNFDYPIMQSNFYDLNRLFFLLQQADCGSVHVEFTRHRRNSGVILYFQKDKGSRPL